MSYDTVATLSQVISLAMFVVMFAAVLVYALWPANGPRFDKVQRSALDLDGVEARRAANGKRGEK
jgi:cytochrome c oxidase cbb3-type subunit 4